jgi:hypothetical protein
MPLLRTLDENDHRKLKIPNAKNMIAIITYIRAISSFGCKLSFWIFRTGKMMSSWFVVCICVERFVAVLFPFKVKILFMKRRRYVEALSTCLSCLPCLVRFFRFNTCFRSVIIITGVRISNIETLVTNYLFSSFELVKWCPHGLWCVFALNHLLQFCSLSKSRSCFRNVEDTW